ELDESRRQRHRSVPGKRQDGDADLPPVLGEAQPVEGDPPRHDRTDGQAAGAPEPPGAAKNGAVVEPIDGHAVEAAIEMLLHESEAADVEAVTHARPRFVHDARACGTQLVIEKEASAVAANARVERMRREDAGPEGDVVDVETRGVAARFVEDVREVGDGEG